MIDRHAVNVLFWDQFTFYQALAENTNAWELFRWQHGPHRQGLPFLLTPAPPADVAIPLLLLTPAQYGIFLHTPNLSHAAGPLVLLLAFCLAFTLRQRALRSPALVALDFLLIHSRF